MCVPTAKTIQNKLSDILPKTQSLFHHGPDSVRTDLDH